MMKARGGSAIKVLIIAAAVLAAAVGTYFFMAEKGPEARASQDLTAYIGAIQRGDFELIFSYNASTQRRAEIIKQRAEDKDRELKDLFMEQKHLFEEAAFTGDLRSLWVEKFLFTPGCTFKILGVEKVKDVENPSQPISKRINAMVSVQVEYPDKGTAPDLNGKVKSAVYIVKMINERDISRILRVEIKENKWLFESISIKENSVKYWDRPVFPPN